jgi:hypothetical protein
VNWFLRWLSWGCWGCWWVETHGWGRKRVLVGPKRAMVCRKRRKGGWWIEDGVPGGGKGVSVTGNECWWVKTGVRVPKRVLVT